MMQRANAPKASKPVSPSVMAKQVPVTFAGADDMPLEFVNAFVPQIQPDFIVLICAQVMPPVITGDPEQIRAAAARVGQVTAKTISRLVLTPEKAQELIVVLGQALEQQQDMVRRIAEEMSNEPASD